MFYCVHANPIMSMRPGMHGKDMNQIKSNMLFAHYSTVL